MIQARTSFLALPLLAAGLLSACGGVKIRPEPKLPAALISPMPAKVGVVMSDDMRKYLHKETRWGVEWQVDLGTGHDRMVRDLFKAAFSEVVVGPDVEKLRETPGLKAIFEPRVEQYSFATARETGGRYYAVTIRYRVNLYTPTGERADSYTLTGYGNALAKGVSSGKPLARASVAAMRDAAAKFLVQFPDQPAGKRLALNEVVEVEKPQTASAGLTEIEAVPIDEPQPGEAQASTPPAPKTGGPASGPGMDTASKPISPAST